MASFEWKILWKKWVHWKPPLIYLKNCDLPMVEVPEDSFINPSPGGVVTAALRHDYDLDEHSKCALADVAVAATAL